MKVLATLFAFALLAFYACPVNAGDKEKGSKDKSEKAEKDSKGPFLGTVSVTRNDKKKIEKITLACEDGKTYVLASTKLPKGVDDGDTVEITGAVKEKKGEDGTEELVLSTSKIVAAFKGKVEVEKGDKGEKITLGGTEVKASGKGKEMGEKAAGKEVVAYGEKKTEKSKDGETTILMITDYKLADEKK